MSSSSTASTEANERKRPAEQSDSRTTDPRSNSPRWPPIATYNKRFDFFYRAVLGMPDKEQSEFLEALKAFLPACFHMNPDLPFTKELQEQVLRLCDEVSLAASVSTDSDAGKEKAPPIKPLKWYPHQCGYQFGMDRRTIRKDPTMEKLHKWLKEHTDNGNITRQEAVSMVPPLALHVMPHHKCLDMCAAPGSKTSQLLEIVNRSVATNKQTSLANSDACQCVVCVDERASRSIPEEDFDRSGLVVANDADTDRAYMLVHQCKRINSPLLLITTHKGQHFPKIVDPATNNEKTGFFDRVLCDVPCSGDGTLRKNPEIWQKWNTGGSFSLHPLQLQIACRGIDLLKEGGLIVYSTCSMSPYEDEAVVAELLRIYRGQLELVDAREFVPLFSCREGLTSWPVIDDAACSKKDNEAAKRAKVSGDSVDADTDANSSNVKMDEGAKESNSVNGLELCLSLGMEYYKAFEDVPPHLTKKIRKSVFPPSADEVSWMNLNRCMRCLPHDEDTGGFFVATFRKKLTTSASTSTAESLSSDAMATEVAEPARSVAKGYVEYQKIPQDNFDAIKSFYSLSDKLSRKEFWFREDFSASKGKQNNSNNKNNNNGQEETKAIFYLPPSVQSIMAGDVECKLKLVSAGVKAIERKTAKGSVDYRVNQEGLPYLGPFIGSRRIAVTVQDICNMLEGGLVSFSTLSSATLAAVQRQSGGSIVCSYFFNPDDVIGNSSIYESSNTSSSGIQTNFSNYVFHVICWKGPTKTLNVMGTKDYFTSIKEQLISLKVHRAKVTAKSLQPLAEASSSAIASKEDSVTDHSHHTHSHAHSHSHESGSSNLHDNCCGGGGGSESNVVTVEHDHSHGP